MIEVKENTMRFKWNSEPQRQFFESDEDEVLFGGSSGSGKSISLVIEPLRYVHLSDFTGIIFRRTYPELMKSIQPHCERIYPYAGAEYHAQTRTWKFPSGAVIRLGYMQFEGDWKLYAGGSYAYQGYDELTTFLQPQWDMLKAWSRSECAVKPYRRATSNPGQIGHAWVKSYFVDKCPPKPDGPQRYCKYTKTWWQPMKSGQPYTIKEKTGAITSRRFIPARVFDNIDLLRLNPQYVNTLLQLPLHSRKALLEGNWDLFEGQYFSMFNKEIHVIDPFTEPPPENQIVMCGIDYGNVCVMEMLTVDKFNNIIVFGEVYTEDMYPEEKAELMADACIEKGLKNFTIVYDRDMTTKQDYYLGKAGRTPLALFQKIFKDKMGNNAPRWMPPSKKPIENRRFRIACNEAIRNMLAYSIDDKTGKFTRTPSLFVTSDCPYLIRAFSELVHDKDSYRGLDFIKVHGLDDPYDALKYPAMIIKPVNLDNFLKEESNKSDWETYLDELRRKQSRHVFKRSSWRNPGI